jgi:phosphomannomutase
MAPRLTVSGYRGIWGESITEDIARDYARAFGALVVRRGGTKVLVGRDGRKSGAALLEAVIGELLALGLDVLDLGMMPTPTVLFLIRAEQAAGAVIVTASHNPIEYNGLKFATETGAFTTEADVAEMEALRRPGSAHTSGAAEDCLSAASSAGKPGVCALPGRRVDGSSLFSKHLDVIADHVDFEKIKSSHFKVAIDPINSVGCTTTPKLLAEMGSTIVAINAEATGDFAHEPEPVTKNLSGLAALVRETGADVGFAQDPDGDRLVLVDETGAILSEELTLPLCLKAILRKTAGDVVVNLSTSNVSEDVARAFGGRTFRSKVGEANVVATIREHGAVAGGEGSSGPIWPAVAGTRDSYASMALILELMATEQKPLSAIANDLPKYHMQKSKFPFAGDLGTIYTKLAAAFPEAMADTRDGLRLDFPDRAWLHVRPSNTEPIVRVIAEAGSAARAQELSEKVFPLLA